MQPWKISVGLTAAIVGSTAILIGPRLDYLAPYWEVILDNHGWTVGYHIALAIATIAAVIYAVARKVILSDLGRRVGVAEESVRRGEGDPRLADGLKRDAEGKWN
ncbi:MAG: hypothetical protein F4Y04_03465 [Chloroflexi bacterium]|nr:hypothetical protein [Chloroflexota bacterium]